MLSSREGKQPTLDVVDVVDVLNRHARTNGISNNSFPYSLINTD